MISVSKLSVFHMLLKINIVSGNFAITMTISLNMVINLMKQASLLWVMMTVSGYRGFTDYYLPCNGNLLIT